VLSTELTVFELNASSESDRALLYGPLQELHSHVMQQAAHCPNDTPLGLVARVLHIGEVKQYPTAAHSRFCVIRLRPLTPTLHADEACVVRLLLVDDQVPCLLNTARRSLAWRLTCCFVGRSHSRACSKKATRCICTGLSSR
jgi:hypothetical protein